jgi:hypothetical protein
MKLSGFQFESGIRVAGSMHAGLGCYPLGLGARELDNLITFIT